MKMAIDDLVRRVKVNMEELSDSLETQVEMTVGVDIETYIRSKLPDAILSVWNSMPLSALPVIDCAASLRPESRPDGSGRVALPADMWRMVEFGMEGWLRPVTVFHDGSSAEYELQFNPYTRGGRANPLCTLSNEGGQKWLTYYSLPFHITPHRVSSARYIAYPACEEGCYEIDPAMVSTICHTCAAFVYELLGRPELAAAMLRCIV